MSNKGVVCWYRQEPLEQYKHQKYVKSNVLSVILILSKILMRFCLIKRIGVMGVVTLYYMIENTLWPESS